MLNKIKLQRIILLCLTILFAVNYASSQTEEEQCKVLKEEISDFYQGRCKNGLAHGNGLAKGIDTYEGRFKKGLPHGYGEYIYSNGDRYEGKFKNGKKNGRGTLVIKSNDKKLVGVWRNDEFYKEITIPPYEVIMKSGGITAVNFYKEEKDSPYDIEVIFLRDGNQSRIAGQLVLTSSSGTIKVSSNYSGFENVSFPFEGYIEFSEPNRMRSVMVRYEVKFKIIEEASWRIAVRY